MTVAKRNLCKGDQCRKWKNLNDEGYCKKCSDVVGEEDDETCGMCPQRNAPVSIAANASAETNLPVVNSFVDQDTKVQCDLCDKDKDKRWVDLRSTPGHQKQIDPR